MRVLDEIHFSKKNEDIFPLSWELIFKKLCVYVNLQSSFAYFALKVTVHMHATYTCYYVMCATACTHKS